MAQFDDLLLEVGEIGWYQIALTLIIGIGWELSAAWTMMIMIFIGTDPGWICADNTTIGNDSSTIATPSLHYTDSPLSNLSAPTVKKPDACDVCSSYEFSKEFTSIVTEWELVCEHGFISDTITSVQMAGVFVGSLLFGQLSDLFGRKKPHFLAIVGGSIIGVAQAFATSWVVFAVCRFCSGVFTAGTIVVGGLYGIEYLGPKYRHIPMTFGLWTSFSLLLLAFAYFIRNWRHLLLVASAPGLAVVASWWFLPESPRWLLSQGRYKEVTSIVKRIAKSNKKPEPDMGKFIKEYESQTPNAEHGVKYGYWDLFRTPTLAKQTLIFCFSWFCMSLISYGAVFNVKNLPGNKFVNMAVNFAIGYFLPIALLGLPRWFGRKTITIASFLIAAVSFIPILVIYIIGKSEELWVLIIVLTTIGTTAVGMAWQVFVLLKLETYPTAIRNIGIGFSSMFARIGGILAPQMAYFSTFWKPIPFVISGILAVACAVVTYLLKETKNKVLIDTVPDREWCLCCSRNNMDDTRNDANELVSKVSSV
ncbi:organic cation transporter protein [Lingula anatina]|uniref:Organic cation transporter protein n=1 Tax=Lingula anatina TaxID=7574 RepID=A0A1S3KEN9_LINAN|nr:organic cation transporter protein [Lingula anatina]|eukprot:XP_013421095.1 organic cation transporter protein [Lingula anatina]